MNALPLPRPALVGADGAAVELDEVANDREPYAEASSGAVRGLPLLGEQIEHVRQELGVMPMPVSFTREDDLVPFLTRLDRRCRPRGRCTSPNW